MNSALEEKILSNEDKYMMQEAIMNNDSAIVDKQIADMKIDHGSVSEAER